MNKYEKAIRDIPDYPKKGVIFKDITPLLADPELFKDAVKDMSLPFKDISDLVIAGVESRGFIFGAAAATFLGVPFIPIRKKGKLPYKTISESYELEYGTDTLEIHEDAISKGQKVVIFDDLLATGGTVNATAKLIKKVGGEVIGLTFLIELAFLHGKDKVKDYRVHSLITYN